jgi:cephalosporin hydroxylase
MKLNTVYWKGKQCHQNMEDLFNYQHVIWEVKPRLIIEVGPGEHGTFTFLRDLGVGRVESISEKDEVPKVSGAFIIIDSDVYNQEAIIKDLETYSPMAKYLVVCHTIREDWGSGKALYEWMKEGYKKFTMFDPPYPTRHSWLKRI